MNEPCFSRHNSLPTQFYFDKKYNTTFCSNKLNYSSLIRFSIYLFFSEENRRRISLAASVAFDKDEQHFRYFPIPIVAGACK